MIKKEQVEHIAKLARLGLTKKELLKFQKDLSKIIDYFNSLQESDVSQAGPAFLATEKFLKTQKEPGRQDEPAQIDIESVKRLRESFPSRQSGYIKVKPVF